MPEGRCDVNSIACAASPFKRCWTTCFERKVSVYNSVSEFLDNRIEEIAQTLRKNNGEYLLAAEKRKSLFMNIDPIIKSESDITISAGDCLNFREYFDQEFVVAASLQHELYRQGYRDCVKLLTMLGLLAGCEERI